MICQWHLTKLHLALWQIRLVVPWYEPTVEPNKSARRHVRINNQSQEITRGLPDTYPSEYRRVTHKRGITRSTPISQWKYSVYVVEPRRRSACTPHADNGKLGIRSIDRFCVCAAAKPGRLPAYHSKLRRPKHLWCNAPLFGIVSQGDWPHQHNRPRNADAETRAGGTGTSKWSPYQIKHGGNCAIGTYDCDHEHHAGVTQDASGGSKKPNKA